MTELLAEPVPVRCGEDGVPRAVRLRGGWRAVERVVNRWRVETDWWRTPVRRDTWRCLLSDGACVELGQDLDSGAWALTRRYD